jgi:hypothetical protein
VFELCGNNFFFLGGTSQRIENWDIAPHMDVLSMREIIYMFYTV